MVDLMPLLTAAKGAKAAAAALEGTERDRLLLRMADALEESAADILEENEMDLTAARGRVPDVMLDRLRLDEARIAAMAAGMRAVAALASPLGQVEQERTLASGLRLRRVRVPMGVVAIIYESRPNVTTDAAALCLKTGNVCVLRGGSDAINSNTVLADVMRGVLAQGGHNPDMIQIVSDTSHDSANALMAARGYVDLLIPRGGKNLIAAVVEGAKGVPVIETGIGICHVYVDKAADLDMAASILYNAKTSRPSVCNSAEVCLVHSDVAAAFLPKAAQKLAEKHVELRLDERAAALVAGVSAGPKDFDTEFNDYILAVGVVDTLQQAIDHINTHSSGHSDAIVTADEAAATAFLAEVDSAAVYHNASTRFTDGGEFGLGCEMGISTQKLGARGPMGLHEMTSYKYTLQGTGQVR